MSAKRKKLRVKCVSWEYCLTEMRNPLGHKTKTEHTETLSELGLSAGQILLCWNQFDITKIEEALEKCLKLYHSVLHLVWSPMQCWARAVWGVPLPQTHGKISTSNTWRPKNDVCNFFLSQSSNSYVPTKLLHLRPEALAVHFPQRITQKSILLIYQVSLYNSPVYPS